MLIIITTHYTIKCEISYALVCNVIKHIPSLSVVGERCINIYMANATAITIVVESGTNINTILQRSMNTKRNPLVAVQRKVFTTISGYSNVSAFKELNCRCFPRNLLNINHVIFGRSELWQFHYDTIQRYACQSHKPVRHNWFRPIHFV